MELPERVMKDVEAKSEQHNIPYETLVSQIQEVMNTHDAVINRDFASEESKITFAWRICAIQLLQAGSVKPYDVLVFGISRLRKTRKGDYSYRLYGIINNKVVTIIVNSKKLIDQYSSFKINSIYNDVLLSGDLENNDVAFTTHQTAFVDPTEIAEEKIEQLFFKVGKEFELIDIENNLSARQEPDDQGREYVDETDLKVVKGIIGRCTLKDVDEKITNLSYFISDESLEFADSEERTIFLTDGGVLDFTSLLVLTSPVCGVFDEGWECYFLGTIDTFENGKPFMNAINIIPSW